MTLRTDGLPKWWTQLERDAVAIPVKLSTGKGAGHTRLGRGHGMGMGNSSGVREANRSRNAAAQKNV